MTIREAYEKRDYKQMNRLIDQLQSKEEWNAVLKDNKGSQLGMILERKQAVWELEEKMNRLGIDPLDVVEEILQRYFNRVVGVVGEDDLDSRCLKLARKLLRFHRDREINERYPTLIEDGLDDIIAQAKALKEARSHDSDPEGCSDEIAAMFDD